MAVYTYVEPGLMSCRRTYIVNTYETKLKSVFLRWKSPTSKREEHLNIELNPKCHVYMLTCVSSQGEDVAVALSTNVYVIA